MRRDQFLIGIILLLVGIIVGSMGNGATARAATYAQPHGVVQAAPKPPAGGDITAVLAGQGLLGGGTQGDVTLSADTSFLQQRVSAMCDSGSAIRTINADGSVLCELDDTAGSGGGVQMYFVSGNGLNLTGALNTIGPVLPITVASGQKVFVTASKALGSAAAGGGQGLTLYMCYRATSGADTTLHTIGQGLPGLRVPQNTRLPFTQSASIEGLSGNYEVGMCGHSTSSASWNDNDLGTVTAIVSN